MKLISHRLCKRPWVLWLAGGKGGAKDGNNFLLLFPGVVLSTCFPDGAPRAKSGYVAIFQHRLGMFDSAFACHRSHVTRRRKRRRMGEEREDRVIGAGSKNGKVVIVCLFPCRCPGVVIVPLRNRLTSNISSILPAFPGVDSKCQTGWLAI